MKIIQNKIKNASSQYLQIQKGGKVVLRRKIKRLPILLWDTILKLLARIVVPINNFLKIEWTEAYYFEGERFSKKFYTSLAKEQTEVFQASLEALGNQAIAYFEKALKLRPNLFQVYAPLWNIRMSMGKKERMPALIKDISTRDNFLQIHQFNNLNIEFLPRWVAIGSFGNMLLIDTWVKANLLGLCPQKQMVLLLPPGFEVRISNPYLLKCWERYITIISDPLLVSLLEPMEKYLERPIGWVFPLSEKAQTNEIGNGLIQRQWDLEDRPPLLNFSNEDCERGWQCLGSKGVPRDSWFVCLHVREPGWRDNSSPSDDYRNADIKSYLFAIKTITDAGGWVIRMGNSGMSRLPSMERVIDYAHSDIRTDWMDIFLGSQCRFMIGTSSGVYIIPIMFGVPFVLTNVLPIMSLYTCSNKDLSIPRVCMSLKEERHLSFQELMSPPVSTMVSSLTYQKHGIGIIENTPEEINQVVLEMMERLDGSLECTLEDENLQQCFNSLSEECSLLYENDQKIGINSRIGRDFLKKYASLLPNNDQQSHIGI